MPTAHCKYLLAVLLFARAVSSKDTDDSTSKKTDSSSQGKCSPFPELGSKYGSDGGSLFNNAFKDADYGFQVLPECGTCAGHEGINRYKKALPSTLPGVSGHFLQVLSSDGQPGYTTGNKVIRALYTGDADAPLLKIREYTFQNDGGYYRRSRFFKFSCPGAFTEISTTETKANSKASYGFKQMRLFSKSSSVKDFVFDSDKQRSSWILKVNGSKPWLLSRAAADKDAGQYYTAAAESVIRMESQDSGKKSPVSSEYYFSTYPVDWEIHDGTMHLQEDLMESVITVSLEGLQDHLTTDSVLELTYEVYTGTQAKLGWDEVDMVLSVTPVDFENKAAISDLTEYYKFEAFALCLADGGISRLDFESMKAKLPQNSGSGLVSIKGQLPGISNCKKVVWDPTNGELAPSNTTAAKMKCGDVRKAYKASCCKKPADTPFAMQKTRRLPGIAKAIDEASLKATIRQALREGQVSADEIRSIVAEYL